MLLKEKLREIRYKGSLNDAVLNNLGGSSADGNKTLPDWEKDESVDVTMTRVQL